MKQVYIDMADIWYLIQLLFQSVTFKVVNIAEWDGGVKEHVHTPVPVDKATTTWSIQHMCRRSVCVDDLSQPTHMPKTTFWYHSYNVVTVKLSDNITLKYTILLYDKLKLAMQLIYFVASNYPLVWLVTK